MLETLGHIRWWMSKSKIRMVKYHFQFPKEIPCQRNFDFSIILLMHEPLNSRWNIEIHFSPVTLFDSRKLARNSFNILTCETHTIIIWEGLRCKSSECRVPCIPLFDYAVYFKMKNVDLTNFSSTLLHCVFSLSLYGIMFNAQDVVPHTTVVANL